MAAIIAAGTKQRPEYIGETHSAIAFARYIAAHEEPPADPLAESVQAIADDHSINLSAMPRVEKALLAAIQRGIEIGRDQ